jgi:hypothetical protein
MGVRPSKLAMRIRSPSPALVGERAPVESPLRCQSLTISGISPENDPFRPDSRIPEREKSVEPVLTAAPADTKRRVRLGTGPKMRVTTDAVPWALGSLGNRPMSGPLGGATRLRGAESRRQR